MEIFELKYFLAVAQVENVNKAAGIINISAGSLSKAVARLEAELQSPLFYKSGRGIRLSPAGIALKRRALQIIQLEEDTRLELMGSESGSLNAFISSEEVLQTSFGIAVAMQIGALFPQARIHFSTLGEARAIEQVMEGEAHLALITGDPPVGAASKLIGRVEFKTCASRAHPLVKRYGSNAVPIEEVLKHPFVCPESSILGKISRSTSTDGWRDDKFPRKLKFKASGLKLMENLIQEGMALGYLPDYFIEASGLVVLKVSGCPYSCQQAVRLLAKDPKALGWLNRFWGNFPV